MPRRSRAREVALQILFQEDLSHETASSGQEAFIRSRLRDPELQKLASDFVAGVRTKRAEIDRLISEIAEHWTLERMNAADRNILRLGSYEILFADTPPKVAIDEAVELAKRYGTSQSSQFVNGILDRVLRFKDSGEAIA